MLPRSETGLLQDLVDLARETIWHLDGVDLDEFLEDLALQRAIERTLELVGEAATRLGDRLPDIGIDWAAVKGLRILLAHVYERIDPNRLYTAATLEVPDLLVRLQRHLDEQDPTESRS